MGILGRLLTLPVLGPIDGVLWIARTIEQQVERERWDDGKVIGALTELELDLDLGKIDIEEYDAREAILLQRLKDIREAKNDE